MQVYIYILYSTIDAYDEHRKQRKYLISKRNFYKFSPLKYL